LQHVISPLTSDALEMPLVVLLYEQFSVERETLKKHLEEEFQREQEKSARELISSFNHICTLIIH
jgi:hypothetical protein